MKPSSIRSLLLVSALFMPHARGQDAEAKIRDIEQTVLLKNYEDSVKTLAATAGGPDGANPDAIGKQLLWLAKVDSELDTDGKAAAAARENMPETADTLNDMAWQMVTAPEAAGRQPETALKLATLALELGAGDKELLPKALDTRARALFLLGRQGEAISEQEKAVAASDAVPQEKPGFEATLAAYRKNELPPAPPAIMTFRSTSNVTGVPTKNFRDRLDRIALLQIEAAGASDASSTSARKELEDLKEELRKRLDDMPKTFGGRLMKQEEPASGTDYIMGKLRTIVLPQVDFSDISLEEAVDFLRLRAKELDITENDPSRKGVNFVIRRARAVPAPVPGAAPGSPAPDVVEPGASRIKELRLRNVPLAVALKYLCEVTHMRFKVDDFAVTFVPQDEVDKDLFTRVFFVPTDFTTLLDPGSGAGTAQGARRPVIELFKANGISFGDGCSATLGPSGRLMITNTPTQLDKIEQLIEAIIPDSVNSGAGTFAPVPDAAPATQPAFPAQPDAR